MLDKRCNFERAGVSMRNLGSVILISTLGVAFAIAADYPVTPVPFTAVRVDAGFWAPRMEVNRTVTIPFDFTKCEETGRIRNFAIAGGLEEGDFKGIYFDDSDVFKVIEGASYSLSLHPDPALDAYLDDLIATIAAAQEDDGYLYTFRTTQKDDPEKVAKNENLRDGRWGHLQYNHELYNVGHMYEAAVAHFQATGKRSLLDVALKNADLICSVFGPERRLDVPGHQEIELGLVKLYRVTGERKYLDQAQFFLDMRGNPAREGLYGPDLQDHAPVLEQEEAVGHAVRAGYMYAAMTDIAALSGDARYAEAVKRLWDDVVAKKLSITGGVGARRSGEKYGDAYELPNATAYNETCAAIALALWNYRMFLLEPDARYIDVLERVMYNGFLVGVSLSGDRFFYPNPLESNGVTPFNHGSAERQPWFGTSCCPTNVVRFLPSLMGYVYAQRDDALFVNLFMDSEASFDHVGAPLTVRQDTKYPWEGVVRITLTPERAAAFPMLIRIPGWSRGDVVPGGLYRYADSMAASPKLRVNGDDVPLELMHGYAKIAREWNSGDVIELELPMQPRRVVADERIETDRGKVAIERGPVVYCIEAVDTQGEVFNLLLPHDANLEAEHKPELLGGVTIVRGEAIAYESPNDGGEPLTHPRAFTAIPYYAWAHRGASPMAVWIAAEPDAVRYPGPVMWASHNNAPDSVEAAMDGIEPGSSGDQSVPRFTWWDHRGREEWIACGFPNATRVSEVDVYWFDDSGTGECRVPKKWHLEYRDGDDWKPVDASGPYGVAQDAFNTVAFEPVTTEALRIVVQLQPKFSGGVLEWRVR